MTPENFRAGTVYPGSFAIDLMPFIQSLTKRIEDANRRRREEAARRKVREALDELARARAAAPKQG